MKKEKNLISFKMGDLPPISSEDRKMLRTAGRKKIDFSDVPEITKEEWSHAYLVNAKTKERISARIAADTDSWFRRFGKDYEARINAALKVYMLAHQPKA